MQEEEEMESWFEFGLEAIRWLQSTYPQLEDFFRFITSLGRNEFYLAILPIFYWCVDKQMGKHLVFVFFTSVSFNALLKHSLRGPRPFWLDSSVGLGSAGGYGVPSGHTQLATTLYIFMAVWFKKRWLWLIALFLTLAMGVSRIYLGVHFVHDVVAGYLVALLVLAGYAIWKKKLAKSFHKRILGQRLLAAISFSLFFVLIYIGIRLLIGEPDLSVEWADFIPDAEITSIEDMALAFGVLFGLGVAINLESIRLRFKADGPVWKRVVRYFAGIIVTAGIWLGLKEVFPAEPLWLGIPLRILRYFLVAVWVGYYAPLLFVKLRLADSEPREGIDLTM